VSALAALGAEVLLRGANGARTMPVEDYMTGALECALAPDELLEAVRLPILSAKAQWGFVKVCRKTGEYAHAIGAVLLDPPRGVCRLAIGATERKPLVLTDAGDVFGGHADRDGLGAFDPRAIDAMLQKSGMTDAIDRQIHTVALARAVQQAARA
jgi:carbon-monoxide dehydrogenase medium subunit